MKGKFAAPLTFDSIVDGPGLRITIWAQGCLWKCPGCHNANTHDFDGGFEEDIEKIANEIISYPLKSGVTFSGGDPMFQPEAFTLLAKILKEHNINIWCYTGYVYENIVTDKQKELLKYIDVLVDGKFEQDKHSYDLKYRGSSNQRVIDVKKSLENEQIILFDNQF